MSNADSLNLSVVIITLNEESNLRRCLQSLPRGSEVFVLDSGSTDRTVEIAEELGATASHRPFTNHADQKNAAIALATRDWILSIDADETLDDEARDAIERVVRSAPGKENAYRLPRRLIFMGRAMRFGKTNDAPIRLFRRGSARFRSAIHESLVVDGEVGHLSGRLFHYSYRDLSDYFARFNSYTSKVAAGHKERGVKTPSKASLALRFWFEFVQRYVLRLGFLDGYPGYVYALISSLYAFTKYEKLRELSDSQHSAGVH